MISTKPEARLFIVFNKLKEGLRRVKFEMTVVS